MKLNGRSNLRGNNVAKTLIANGQSLFKDETVEKENDDAPAGEDVQINDKDDEDLL